MQIITNPAFRELVELGLCRDEDMQAFHDKTRDLPIPVYRDKVGGLLALERMERSDQYYRQEKAPDRDPQFEFSLTETADGSILKTRTLNDQARRFHQFRSLLENADICDFGAGYGGFLAHAASVAKSCSGVELRGYCHEYVRERLPHIRFAESLDAYSGGFDVVTLFHVLEHLPQQIAILTAIRNALKPGGAVVIEVPHAHDFLLQSVTLPEFRDFTFWSEHLILHTRDSLAELLKAAGFSQIEVQPWQRYGYTNHLNWFLNRKPGGHDSLKHLEDPELERAYRLSREKSWTCDTLMAVARA